MLRQSTSCYVYASLHLEQDAHALRLHLYIWCESPVQGCKEAAVLLVCLHRQGHNSGAR